MQGRLRRAPVDLGQRMLQQLDGRQDLKHSDEDSEPRVRALVSWYSWAGFPPHLNLSHTPLRLHLGEERPLLLHFLHTVSHQPLHGLGAVLVELAEVW